MANQLYNRGREGFADGTIDWDTNLIRAVLVRTVQGPLAGGNPIYVFDPTHVVFQATLPFNGYCRPTTAITLTTRTALNGYCKSDSVVFPNIAIGDAIQAMIIYQDGGSDLTSRYIAYLDTGIGLPVTPNSGDIQVDWDVINGIFRI